MLIIQTFKSKGRRCAGTVYRLLRRLRNSLAGQFHTPYSRVYYVVEGRNWSVSWDGRYISRYVRKLAKVRCMTARSHQGITRQVVHFGSRNAYLLGGFRDVHPSNKVVFTWFHGNEKDTVPDNQYMISKLPECIPYVEKVVTSSSIGKRRLASWGVPESKIAVIPLGIDLARFQPGSQFQRSRMRAKIGIPDNAICIGSFQKDGVGWEEGMEPKMIKGPDIFLQVMERLTARYRLFVLLTGPARGYVKRGLETLGIAYSHHYLKNYLDIVRYFHCLDLYLVTSRDEGGPKAILECMATGVPIVSTRVGMAQDLITTNENGCLTDIEDTDSIAEAASRLCEQPELREHYILNGLDTAARYDWSAVALRYYKEVYEPLLNQ